MSSGAGDAPSPTMPSFAIGDVIPSAAEDLSFSMVPDSKGPRSDRCGTYCHYSKRVAGSAEFTGSKMPREWERHRSYKASGKQVCHRGRISVAAAAGFERYLRQMTFSWSCSNSTILQDQQTSWAGWSGSM